jgi:hypothetical protein
MIKMTICRIQSCELVILPALHTYKPTEATYYQVFKVRLAEQTYILVWYILTNTYCLLVLFETNNALTIHPYCVFSRKINAPKLQKVIPFSL